MSTPGTLQRWILAARPRTLPAAVVPVALGASLVRPLSLNVVNTVLCVVVALALQIATNYANDYSDGVRGTDEVRVGPFRLTASRLVPARHVRNAAFGMFGVAGVAGLVLASRTSWWFVAIGITAVFAGWFYTGGKHPYGYYGFGELFVMAYFGFVATVGTAYAQHLTIPGQAWWWGLGAGSMACALLEANNLRDINGDQASGKKTLAARLGRRRASWLYGAFVAGVVVGALGARQPLVAIVAWIIYVTPLRTAFSPKEGRDLLPLLQQSARTQLVVGAFAVVTLWLWR